MNTPLPTSEPGREEGRAAGWTSVQVGQVRGEHAAQVWWLRQVPVPHPPHQLPASGRPCPCPWWGAWGRGAGGGPSQCGACAPWPLWRLGFAVWDWRWDQAIGRSGPRKQHWLPGLPSVSSPLFTLSEPSLAPPLQDFSNNSPSPSPLRPASVLASAQPNRALQRRRASKLHLMVVIGLCRPQEVCKSEEGVEDSGL